MAGPAISYAPPTPQARWAKEGNAHILYDGDIKLARCTKHSWEVASEDGGWDVLDLNSSLRQANESSESSDWIGVREGVEQSSDGKSIRFWSRNRWIEVY